MKKIQISIFSLVAIVTVTVGCSKSAETVLPVIMAGPQITFEENIQLPDPSTLEHAAERLGYSTYLQEYLDLGYRNFLIVIPTECDKGAVTVYIKGASEQFPQVYFSVTVAVSQDQAETGTIIDGKVVIIYHYSSALFCTPAMTPEPLPVPIENVNT